MPPGATIVSQGFSAALHKAAWTKFTAEGAEAIPRVHQTFMRIESSTNAEERMILHGGLPQVPKVASDVVKTPLVDFAISPPVVFRHDEYRHQYVYTKVAADDDQYGKIRGVVSSMGEGAAFTIEQEASNLLNLGQTTEYTGWDGEPLFDAAHQLIGSATTYSNITAAGGPTYATLHVINAYFRRLLNDSGFWVSGEIESIQVSPELAPLWRQLLMSMSAPANLSWTSGTGGSTAYGTTANTLEGTPNMARTFGLTPDKVVENPYLTNIDDTIVVGRGHHMYMLMREAPNTDTYDLDDPKAIAHRIQMRFSVGFTDARRVLLVPGS